MRAFLKIILILTPVLFCTNAVADMSTPPSNALTPKPVTTTPTTTTSITAISPEDASIISSIQKNIATVGILKGFNITSTSQQGAVTLDGTVDTQSQADAAINAAKQVPGVKSVKSNIIVKNLNTTPL